MMLGASHENHEWGVRLNSHEFDRLKAVPDSPVKEKGRREKFNFLGSLTNSVVGLSFCL